MSVKNRLAFILLPPLLLLALAGCDEQAVEVDEYIPEAVLHAYLITGEPFGEIRLEWVQKGIELYYSPQSNGIPDAEVRIFTVLDANEIPVYPGDPEYQEVIYQDNGGGLYTPGASYNDDPVRGGFRYRLEAKRGEDLDLYAETTAPNTYELTIENYPELNDSLDIAPPNPEVFNSASSFTREDPSISLTWVPPWPDVSYDSDAKGGMIFNIVSLADTSDLEPLDPNWDPNNPDDALDPEDYIRAMIFWSPDYFTHSELMWIFFQWVGPYRLDIMAASNEYSRYIFTSYPQDPTGGEVLRTENYVQGGFGCFGAVAVHSLYINMLKIGPNITLPHQPVEYNSHDFGEVAVGDTASWELVVYNTGSETLSISSIISSDTAFTVEENGPWNMERAGTRAFTVVFAPGSAGSYQGDLTIHSNDPMEPGKRISLVGTGL